MTTSTTAVAAAASMVAAPAFAALPFEGFVFFNIDCTVYTARKKITPADLGLRDDELPPATLASLGSMHSADPKSLTKFESYRAAMRNACLVYGVRCLGGYAVPKDKAAETAQKLHEIVAEFYALKATFLIDFEVKREAWLLKPEFIGWTDKIRARLDPVSHVDKQLQCDFQAFTLGALTELPRSTTDDIDLDLSVGVTRAFNSIEDQACKELGAMAKTLFEQSFFDEDGNARTEVTQKILSPIRRILEKADALSFAAPNLRHVITYSKSVLSLLPTKGKMTNKDLTAVFNLVDALQRPEVIIRSATLASTTHVEVSEEDAQAIQMILGTEPAQTIDPDSINVEDDIASSDAEPVATPAPSSDDQVEADGDVVYDDCF